MEPVREVLGGVFGMVAVLIGAVVGLIGVPILILGISVGLYGEGHYPPWLALIIVPIGAVFLFVGYGAVRLGWDAMKTNPKSPTDSARR